MARRGQKNRKKTESKIEDEQIEGSENQKSIRKGKKNPKVKSIVANVSQNIRERKAKQSELDEGDEVLLDYVDDISDREDKGEEQPMEVSSNNSNLSLTDEQKKDSASGEKEMETSDDEIQLNKRSDKKTKCKKKKKRRKRHVSVSSSSESSDQSSSESESSSSESETERDESPIRKRKRKRKDKKNRKKKHKHHRRSRSKGNKRSRKDGDPSVKTWTLEEIANDPDALKAALDRSRSKKNEQLIEQLDEIDQQFDQGENHWTPKMSLNSEETKLVQESWEVICGESTGITQTGIELFIRTFTASPDIQQFFKFAKNKTLKQLETSPRLAIHASNIMNVIGQGAANASDMSKMEDYLTELGGKHNRFGAEDEYFEVIGVNLVELLKDKLGEDKWTSGHTDAWRKLFAAIKTSMMKGLTEARAK